MKVFLKILILIVSITVLSAWTFRLEMDTIYRGADASNMIEEFQAYGLSKTTMIVVGIFATWLLLLLWKLSLESFLHHLSRMKLEAAPEFSKNNTAVAKKKIHLKVD